MNNLEIVDTPDIIAEQKTTNVHNVCKTIATYMVDHLRQKNIRQYQMVYDASVMLERQSILQHLEEIRNTPTDILHQAFGFFGLYETHQYLQSLATNHQLDDHKALLTAALKLDQPLKSWDEIEAQAEALSPLLMKNPHTVIKSFAENMQEVIRLITDKGASIDALPFVNDRIYLNSILGASVEYNIDIDPSARLIEYVLNHCEQQGPALTTETELRLAGILTLGCMAMPGFDANEDSLTINTEITAQLDLAIADTKIVRQGWKTDYSTYAKEQTSRIETIKKRIKTQQEKGLQIFGQPISIATHLCDYAFAKKLHAALQNNQRPTRNGVQTLAIKNLIENSL